MGKTGPGSLSRLRLANIELLLAALDQGPTAQVELSRATGLSAGLVSLLVRQLEAEGRVSRTPGVWSGRRASIISRVEDAEPRLSCIFPQGDSLEIVDWHTNKLIRKHLPATSLSAAISLAADVIERTDDATELALVLPQRLATQVVSWLAGSKQVEHSRLAQVVGARAKPPLILSRASAVASYISGSRYLGDSASAIILCPSERDLDSVLLLKGVLWHGTSHSAGVIVGGDDNRPVAEGFSRSSDRLERSGIFRYPLTVSQVLARATLDDEVSRQFLRDMGHVLARSLAPLLRFLDIQTVVVEGPLAASHSTFLSDLRTELSSLVERVLVVALVGPSDPVTLGALLGLGNEVSRELLRVAFETAG